MKSENVLTIAAKYSTMHKQFYIYIITNRSNRVLYTGVTNDLKRRVYEYRNKLVEGFTKKYNIVKLVYYEAVENSYSAISREKQIKAGSRERKIKLIESKNPKWKGLFFEL